MTIVFITVCSLVFTCFFLLFIFNSRLRDKQEVLSKHPFHILVLAPVFEELVFRFLPAAIFGPSWEIGILMSILFGLVHSAKIFKSQFTIDFRDIHWIPATLGGLWFWFVYVEYGLLMAIYAHFLNNLITYSVVKFQKTQ